MRKFPFRRTTIVGVVWMGVLAVLLLGQPAATVSGQEALDPGTGDAYAQGIKVDPRTGGLSLGLALGESLAGHQNTLAIAEAKSLNLGIIGTILAGEGCDGGDPTLPADQQPQPLMHRTDEDGSSASDSDVAVSRRVEVNNTPFALANAVVDGGDLGILGLGATETTTTSGVIDGRRVARAETTVASIDLLGVVQIEGLRWVAEYQSEPEVATITDFEFGGITVAGLGALLDTGDADGPLAGIIGTVTNILDELTSEVFDNLEDANAILDLLGIRITPPRAFVAEGIAFVDPLRISIVPNEARDGVLGQLLDAIQPIREELVDLVFGLDCSTQTVVTVADIVIGSLSGAGSLNLELGGVTATSGDFEQFDFGEFPAPPPPPPAPPAPEPAPPPTPAPDASSATAPVETTAPPTTSLDNDEVAAPVADTRPLSGVRGGPLLWTGLAGLVLLGILAELDRRKMRKAQRVVAAGGTT